MRKSRMPAIPVTTVQKIMTVMIMVIRRMSPSPNGFMATAVAGRKKPSKIASAIAALTCSQRDEWKRLGAGAFAGTSDCAVAIGILVGFFPVGAKRFVGAAGMAPRRTAKAAVSASAESC